MTSNAASGLDVDRDRLAQELCSLNALLQDRAMALVGPMPLPPDLTMQQLRALGQVVKNPGVAGHELGDLLGVSAPTASGLIERMVEKQLVSREEDPEDRRIRRIRPTDGGLEVMRQLHSVMGRVLSVVVSRLSLDDLELLCRGSRAMLAALEEAGQETGGG